MNEVSVMIKVLVALGLSEPEPIGGTTRLPIKASASLIAEAMLVASAPLATFNLAAIN